VARVSDEHDSPAGVESVDEAPAPKHFVRAVARALAVIRTFDAGHPRLTLSEVAARTGLDRATSRRLLLTLRDLGYVEQSRRDFALTPRVLELGYSYLSGATLVEVARPHLQHLADLLHETASLSVLDGEDVVYLDLASSRRITAVQIKVGTRFPAHATSMGRILLGELPEDELDALLERATQAGRGERTHRSAEELRSEIRTAHERGWAIVDQELEAGLTGIAAPVRSRDGAIVAAINVSAHGVSGSIDELARAYVPPLKQAAEEISRDYVPT